MDLLLLCLPWIGVGLFVALFVRIPPGLPQPGRRGKGEAPAVSVIVPARNEEENVSPLLRSLTATEYADFEVLVVDDRSEDRTAGLVAAAEPGNARELRLIPGEPLPEGWFGKPWACMQGARVARGDLLLFTDADTLHHPLLLGQAVEGLESEGADVLTLVGRQVMGSFWERLLQPQFFSLLAFRFPRVGTPRRPSQWRHAIANGQYLLFRREVYESLGGHGSVRGDVVEDLRLAQLLVREGRRLVVRDAPGLRTRMYRSLPGLVEGWSKNVSTAALQTTAGWLLPLILPAALLLGAFLWLLPPTVLAWALVTGRGGILLHFGALSTGIAFLYWGLAAGIMRGNPLYGFLYPLGSILAGYIVILSWISGGRIQWKGRRYTMSREARRGGVGREPPGRDGGRDPEGTRRRRGEEAIDSSGEREGGGR